MSNRIRNCRNMYHFMYHKRGYFLKLNITVVLMLRYRELSAERKFCCEKLDYIKCCPRLFRGSRLEPSISKNFSRRYQW